MTTESDAVVVGAGPGGSAVAALLARRGRRVVLIDRASFPRRKLCTHAIMPAGLPVLEELGVLNALERAGAQRWYGARLWLNGVSVAAKLPGRKVAYPYGLSLRRELLDPILVDAAQGEPNVRVCLGAGVDRLLRDAGGVTGVGISSPDGHGEIRAPLVILAGGRNSALAVGAGLRTIAWPNRHSAYVAYLAGVPTECRPGLEGYYWHGRSASLLPADNGLRVAGVMASPGSWPLQGRPERLLVELRRFQPLRERLKDAEVVTTPIEVSGLRNVWRGPAGPGLLLIGDAGVQTDPIFGQGISWALRQAAWAAEAADAWLGGDARALGRFASRRRRVLGHRALAITGVSLLEPGSWPERLFVANATLNPPSTALCLRLMLGFGTVSRARAPRRTITTWLREALRG